MAEDDRDVKQEKGTAGIEIGRWYVRIWTRCVTWFDKNPRLGWYLAAFGIANVVLNLLQIVLQLLG